VAKSWIEGYKERKELREGPRIQRDEKKHLGGAPVGRLLSQQWQIDVEEVVRGLGEKNCSGQLIINTFRRKISPWKTGGLLWLLVWESPGSAQQEEGE